MDKKVKESPAPRCPRSGHTPPHCQPTATTPAALHLAPMCVKDPDRGATGERPVLGCLHSDPANGLLTLRKSLSHLSPMSYVREFSHNFTFHPVLVNSARNCVTASQSPFKSPCAGRSSRSSMETSRSRIGVISGVRHAGLMPALCAAIRPSASMYERTSTTPSIWSASARTS